MRSKGREGALPAGVREREPWLLPQVPRRIPRHSVHLFSEFSYNHTRLFFIPLPAFTHPPLRPNARSTSSRRHSPRDSDTPFSPKLQDPTNTTLISIYHSLDQIPSTVEASVLIRCKALAPATPRPTTRLVSRESASQSEVAQSCQAALAGPTDCRERRPRTGRHSAHHAVEILRAECSPTLAFAYSILNATGHHLGQSR